MNLATINRGKIKINQVELILRLRSLLSEDKIEVLQLAIETMLDELDPNPETKTE